MIHTGWDKILWRLDSSNIFLFCCQKKEKLTVRLVTTAQRFPKFLPYKSLLTFKISCKAPYPCFNHSYLDYPHSYIPKVCIYHALKYPQGLSTILSNYYSCFLFLCCPDILLISNGTVSFVMRRTLSVQNKFT